MTGPTFPDAQATVRWLVAVQSQDFAGARWALGQRTRDATDRQISDLCDAGKILRTHVLRPTWHFVLPEDVRWLLDLTGGRIRAAMAFYDRRHGIDAALLTRAYGAIEAALSAGAHRTRSELAEALGEHGVDADTQRLGHILLHAELDSVVISGPRRGKQVTYARFADRVPPTRPLARDEMLAALTRRYFAGHGPAQVADFAWWSGLTLSDARHGLSLVVSELEREEIGGRTFWCGRPGAHAPLTRSPTAHLLPNFDEFTVAYRDRGDAVLPTSSLDAAAPRFSNILANVVVVNGRVRGGWRRTVRGRTSNVEVTPLDDLTAGERTALRGAADGYSRYLEMPVSLTGW